MGDNMAPTNSINDMMERGVITKVCDVDDGAEAEEKSLRILTCSDGTEVAVGTQLNDLGMYPEYSTQRRAILTDTKEASNRPRPGRSGFQNFFAG